MTFYAARGTAIGAIAILLCLGSMPAALAQAKGGPAAGPTGGTAAGGPGSGGALVLYGTAGICPAGTTCSSNAMPMVMLSALRYGRKRS